MWLHFYFYYRLLIGLVPWLLVAKHRLDMLNFWDFVGSWHKPLAKNGPTALNICYDLDCL
jgi:hypothetical protein